MLRVELLHPAVVHFPVALVLVVFALKIARRLLAKIPRAGFLTPAATTLLFIATSGAWLAYYTGGLAEDVVNRYICDPTVTAQHADYALYLSIGLSFAFAGDLVTQTRRFASSRATRVMHGVIDFVLLPATSVMLFLTAHLGASLTYQQGAAVYRPTEACTEFEADRGIFQ